MDIFWEPLIQAFMSPNLLYKGQELPANAINYVKRKINLFSNQPPLP